MAWFTRDLRLHGNPALGPAAASCWAVGATGVNRDRNGAVHWNGSVWSNAATPKPQGTARDGRGLGGLACTPPSNCWAVGDFDGTAGHAGGSQAVHWNGHKWVLWAQ